MAHYLIYALRILLALSLGLGAPLPLFANPILDEEPEVTKISPAAEEAAIKAAEEDKTEFNESKKIHSEVQALLVALTQAKNRVVYASLFQAPMTDSQIQSFKDQFSRVRNEVVEMAANATGEDPSTNAIQAEIIRKTLMTFSVFISLDMFDRIHQRGELDLPYFKTYQREWNFPIPLHKYLDIFDNLGEVPKDFQVNIADNNFDKEPTLNITLNNDHIYQVAVETLMSRVNDKTYLESFRCIMGYEQLDKIFELSNHIGQKFNQVSAKSGRFCLGLTPIDLFKRNDVQRGNEIIVDYSKDERDIRQILSNSFRGPEYFYSSDLKNALRNLYAASPYQGAITTTVNDAIKDLVLFPERFVQARKVLEEQFSKADTPEAKAYVKNSLSTLLDEQAIEFIHRDAKEAVEKFYEESPVELFDTFSTGQTGLLIDNFVMFVQSYSSGEEFGVDYSLSIQDRLKMAEALFFSAKLKEQIATFPINLSLMTYGELDNLRRQILQRMIMVAQFYSKSEALQFVFMKWLGQEVFFSDEILPEIQEILNSTIASVQKESDASNDSRIWYDWLNSSLESFQKEYKEHREKEFERYVKSLLQPASDLANLFTKPLEMMNLEYNNNPDSSTIEHYVTALRLMRPLSERAFEWMKQVVRKEGYSAQKLALAEKIDFLNENAPKSYNVSSPFSLKSFDREEDQKDFDDLSLYFQLMGFDYHPPKDSGFDAGSQPLFFKHITYELEEEFDEDEIQEILESTRLEVSYMKLSSDRNRLLDFPLTIKGEKKPLFMWLDPYNDLESLGENGIEWLKGVISHILDYKARSLNDLNTKPLPELAHYILHGNIFNLILGDEPVLNQTKAKIQSTIPDRSDKTDFMLVPEYTRLSMLDYHKSMQLKFKAKDKRSEEEYDQLHETYFGQFWWIAGLVLGTMAMQRFAPAAKLTSKLSIFTSTNRAIGRGYMALFVPSAGYDLYVRYQERQPSITADRRSFEDLTYGGYASVKHFSHLMRHLDHQEEANDTYIFTDYFLLGFPIAMRLGGYVWNKFISKNIRANREIRLASGSSDDIQKELSAIGNDHINTLSSHMHNFEMMGINFDKIGTSMDDIRYLFNPTTLQTLRTKSVASDMAYKRYITKMYEKLAPMESNPQLFNRYIKEFFGKRSGEKVWGILKDEYQLLTGIKL